MKPKEIIVKASISAKINITIILSAIIFVMYCKLQNRLFHWENFNPNGIFTIVFLAFLFLGLLSFIKIFDDKPLLIVNNKGFRYRIDFFPFFPLSSFDWNNIKFVELNTKLYAKGQRKTVLIIYRKDSSQTKTIILDDLNYPMEEIISLFREYSKLLNYRDRIIVNQ